MLTCTLSQFHPDVWLLKEEEAESEEDESSDEEELGGTNLPVGQATRATAITSQVK